MERKNVRYVEVENEYRHLKSFIECFPKGGVCSILLVGPPGTAKTTLALTLARDFGAKYEVVDGSEEIERRDLEGVWLIQKDQGTVFVPGSIVKGIIGANDDEIYFLIINEPNAMRQGQQIGFNSLLAEGEVNLFSKAGERFELNKNAKLVVIGTMNLNVLGINELQEAFDDRFWMNKAITYAKPEKEVEILVQMSGCKKEVAQIIVEVANKFREAASAQQLSIPKMFSTRLAVNFAKMITIMKTNFLRENIRDMIINKLAKEPAEIQTAEGILAGKDFEDELYRMLSDNSSMTIEEEVKEVIAKQVEEETSIPAPVVASAKLLTASDVNHWTRKEIKDYMRKNGIVGYSGKVKTDLVQMVLKHQAKEQALKKELEGIF